MTSEAVATMADAAARRKPLCMTPPGTPGPVRILRAALQEPGRAPRVWELLYARPSAPRQNKTAFREPKEVSARVLLDGDPVVHLIDPHDLRVSTVAA